MILTLRFRDGGHNRCEAHTVHVRVGFAWFEGTHDLHLQFDGPGGDNYVPSTDEPDARGACNYLAPHPETGVMTELWSLELRDKLGRGETVTRGYRQKLQRSWTNMNG